MTGVNENSPGTRAEEFEWESERVYSSESNRDIDETRCRQGSRENIDGDGESYMQQRCGEGWWRWMADAGAGTGVVAGAEFILAMQHPCDGVKQWA